MNRFCQTSFFTLIELLIVITITSILSALLLPALNQARSRGRTIKCAANLKNIGTFLELYIAGADDFWPATFYASGQTSTSQSWMQMMVAQGTVSGMEQLGALQVYKDGKYQPVPGTSLVCPDAVGKTGWYRTYAMPKTGGTDPGVGGNSFASPSVYTKNTRIRHASALVALVENAGGNNGHCYFQNDQKGTYFTFMNHAGAANFLFADLHVSLKKGGFMGDYASPGVWYLFQARTSTKSTNPYRN